MLRVFRPFLVAALAASHVFFAPVSAQVPIPLQEQVEVFNSLSPAQQQALIRELQGQLPPAQRDAVIGMLVQQQGTQAPPASPVATGVDIGALAAGIVSDFPYASFETRLGRGDTLVIDFRSPESADDALRAFVQRLQDSNPYQLDGAGRLLLPGVPAIALSGLNIEQATVRLGAERELRPFELTLTHLPLAPIGTDALERFGYGVFRGAPSTFAPTTEIPVPVDYVIGPFDTINVQLFGGQNDQFFLTVGRDGNISFPGIGPLNVSGQTFDAVRELINERVNEQLIGVRASVTLGELRSITVFVLGDVVRAGTYTVSSLATMTNALFLSGGVSEIGSLRNIALNRDGETVTTFDLYELLLNGDTSGDSRLQPGDVIFVPPIGPAVAVDGEVRRPAIYELNGEQTVDQLIALAGGLNATASRATLKLERVVPGRGTSVTDLNLTAAAGGAVQVQDGDVLRIEQNLELLEGSLRLVGNVQREGLYQWRPGMRISDLLPNAELVKPLSDLNYVLIRRETTPNVEMEVLSVDLEAVWTGRPGSNDLLLEPRDTIYVFHLETGRQQYVAPIIQEIESQAEPNEQLQVVRIGGQVRASGEYPLESNMRVSDLLRAGGGLSDAAYGIEAELTRYSIADGQNRETTLIPINLVAVLAGDLGANVPVGPYDYLNIKEISGWREQEAVTIRGQVVFPGTYPIQRNETLSSVLDRAGGLTDDAFPQGSVFLRANLREREREQLNVLANRVETDLAATSLADPNAGETMSIGQQLLSQLRSAAPVGRLVIDLPAIIDRRATEDILLRDGDELLIPRITQEVMVLGEVQYATSHLYSPQMSLTDYIDLSGGLARRADDKRIYIVRADGSVAPADRGRWFRRSDGADILPGDTIVVPLDTDRVPPRVFWQGITEILYNIAIALTAIDRL